jgi:hypothetical protein
MDSPLDNFHLKMILLCKHNFHDNYFAKGHWCLWGAKQLFDMWHHMSIRKFAPLSNRPSLAKSFISQDKNIINN